MDKKIGIVGYGWVGKSMHRLFPNALIYSPRRDLEGKEYDVTYPEAKWEDEKEGYQKEINTCDIVFVCVPTPCPNESKLDTSAVEEAVAWLEVDLIVIRSTMNPGDCDFLKAKYEKNICMQPEYLGETPNHPLLNQNQPSFIVIGGDWSNRTKLIELYATVYNSDVSIRQLSNYAAEIVKLTENRAIAWKVMQMHELYEVCQAHEIDYYTIRDAVYGDDPRFDLWFSFIYPGKLGFHNSKCLKKDPYAWLAWAESAGYDPKVTRAIVEKSKEYEEKSKLN